LIRHSLPLHCQRVAAPIPHRPAARPHFSSRGGQLLLQVPGA
jgi:hypothetical protein